jgi:Xaa-Pro aminopeptidase
MILQRIQKLRAYLRRSKADALLVSSVPNVRYLSGFTGTDCCLLITSREKIFLGDFRYVTQAKQELGPLFSISMVEQSMVTLISRFVRKERVAVLQFEPRHINFDFYSKLAAALKKTRLEPASPAVEQQRQLKTGQELALIRKAVAITKKSLQELAPLIKPGIRESCLKNKLEEFLKAHGAEKIAFDTIVASGPNAAMPHAQTTNRKIGKQEPVIVDVGADYRGYKSDLTRTFFSGRITQYAEYYKHVVNAQDKAISLIRPHRKIRELETAARQVLQAAELDTFFGHALGHGVGLEVHEAPHISARSDLRLMPGMVFTIEPGVYIPGSGGIRIEDMVVVTDKGCEIL